MRLRDPNCDKRKLSDSSRDTIRWSKHSLLPLLSSIPLNRSAHLTVNAAADACAVEETVGIGGWVQLDSNMFWFSQTWKKSVVKRFLNRQVPTIPLPQDIDVDLTSNSGSWLVVSQSQQSLSSRTTPCTLSTARQTSSAIQIQDTKLRARIREGLCDASHALPPPNPPKFRPKSRLPELHYGGLQVPFLHCFASSHPSHSSKNIQPRRSYFRPRPNPYHHLQGSITLSNFYSLQRTKKPSNLTELGTS